MSNESTNYSSFPNALWTGYTSEHNVLLIGYFVAYQRECFFIALQSHYKRRKSRGNLNIENLYAKLSKLAFL